jgi:hypothetical protein
LARHLLRFAPGEVVGQHLVRERLDQLDQRAQGRHAGRLVEVEHARDKRQHGVDFDHLVALDLLPDHIVQRAQLLNGVLCGEEVVEPVEPRSRGLPHRQLRFDRSLLPAFCRETGGPEPCGCSESAPLPALLLDALLVVHTALKLLEELRDEVVAPVKELAQSHGWKVTKRV